MTRTTTLVNTVCINVLSKVEKQDFYREKMLINVMTKSHEVVV